MMLLRFSFIYVFILTSCAEIRTLPEWHKHTDGTFEKLQAKGKWGWRLDNFYNANVGRHGGCYFKVFGLSIRKKCLVLAKGKVGKWYFMNDKGDTVRVENYGRRGFIMY